jgi:hypothetical protein
MKHELKENIPSLEECLLCLRESNSLTHGAEPFLRNHQLCVPLPKIFPSILWNPKVHYRVQKSPPPVPIKLKN